MAISEDGTTTSDPDYNFPVKTNYLLLILKELTKLKDICGITNPLWNFNPTYIGILM